MRRLLSSALLVAMSVSAGAQSPGVREYAATDQTIIPISTKLRFQTIILLPDGENVLDVLSGDKDFWQIVANNNIATVKPSKEGASTNLNLVTASGAVYSFLLTESAAPPDLKVFITSTRVAAPKARYYTSDQVSAIEQELASQKAANAAALARAEQAVAEAKAEYPKTLSFSYQEVRYTRPFYISKIWHDDRFTYMTTNARELPALYELKDGQPSVVNFTVPRQGLYVVPKIVERGYFQLGKQKMAFAVRDE